jgi:hypothetical protein
MKDIVYAMSVGVLASISINGWPLYVTIIGIVTLAHLSEWVESKIKVQINPRLKQAGISDGKEAGPGQGK